MHWAENNSDSQADLQADQMSLPWGLPYLLKVQGKADGWGWQQLQPTISCSKSVRSQIRINLYSLMILHALFRPFSKLLSIKLSNFCLSSVVSLSHLPMSFPSAISALRWGCLEQKGFIPNWDEDSSLDTHRNNWKTLESRIPSVDNVIILT